MLTRTMIGMVGLVCVMMASSVQAAPIAYGDWLVNDYFGTVYHYDSAGNYLGEAETGEACGGIRFNPDTGNAYVVDRQGPRVTEFLASEFPDRLIVGIDRSAQRLAAVVAKGLPNVLTVKTDITREMDETHFFCTQEGFRDLTEASGFRIEAVTRLPAGENRLRDFSRDIALDLGADYGWIQLVLKKA